MPLSAIAAHHLGDVFATIFASNHSDQLLTNFSRSLTPPLLLSCHKQSGFDAEVASRMIQYTEISSSVGGRVPTKLISPLSALQNWGNLETKSRRRNFQIDSLKLGQSALKGGAWSY